MVWSAGTPQADMPTMIQIRDVPDGLHHRIKSRAALAGLSMSDYLLREIELVLARPTREDLLERLARYPESRTSMDLASMVREERERRCSSSTPRPRWSCSSTHAPG